MWKVYKYVFTGFRIQVFFEVICSNYCIQIQSDNACQLKYFECKRENKYQWIEFDMRLQVIIKNNCIHKLVSRIMMLIDALKS